MTNNDIPPNNPHSGFFASIRRSGWERTQPRWIGGVCSGISARTGYDVILIRGLLIILTFFTGVGLALYAIAWALLPEAHDKRIHAEELFVYGRTDIAQGGVAIFLVFAMLKEGIFSATILGSSIFFAPFWFAFWLLIAAGVILFLMQKAKGSNGTAPPSAPQTPHPKMAPPMPYHGQYRTSAFAGQPVSPPGVPLTSMQSSPVIRPSVKAPYRPGPGRRTSFIVLAGSFFVISICGFLSLTEVGILNSLVIFAALLTLLFGGAVLVSGLRGRRGGWISAVGVLVVFALALPALVTAPFLRYLSPEPINTSAPMVGKYFIGDVNIPANKPGFFSLFAGETRLNLKKADLAQLQGQAWEVQLGAGSFKLSARSDLPIEIEFRGSKFSSAEVNLPKDWKVSTPNDSSELNNYDTTVGYRANGEKIVYTSKTFVPVLGSTAVQMFPSDIFPARNSEPAVLMRVASPNPKGEKPVHVVAFVAMGEMSLEVNPAEDHWSGYIEKGRFVQDSWVDKNGSRHAPPMPGTEGKYQPQPTESTQPPNNLDEPEDDHDSQNQGQNNSGGTPKSFGKTEATLGALYPNFLSQTPLLPGTTN